MYLWRHISTVCVTLWILQRFIRARGKGTAAIKARVGTSTGSSEVPDPSPGAAELKPHQYDVFLNHRGPDVKKTFVAHLNAALKRDGFRPFLDAKSIGKGRHVFNSIDKALKGACVHVAIFSKRYAESKYCLNELCDMLKSGQVILPVFYGVEAEDLRWIENGPFKEGFQKHAKRGRIEEIRKWKEALRKMADYRGFRLDEVNGDEVQLIRSVLVEVRSAMPTRMLPGKERYDMHGRMKEVLKMLDGVSVLSLVGMGGIGKTTLAMEIFNHFVSSRQFEKHCFLKDVRSRSSPEPWQLQRELMHAMGRGDCEVKGPSEYERVFDAFICQKVLIVVDDIDDKSQLEALIPDIGKVGCGSRIVITSRERDVVMQAMAGAERQEVYEVPLLNESESRHLFNRHAFLSETPSEGFGDLAAKVADACGGHALSLETIGASLFDKKGREDGEIWLEAVKALQENEDIFGKLRSTYDRLPTDGGRAMFVDIACMMIGMKKDTALRIWMSCKSCSCRTSRTPVLALRRLVDRALVKVDTEGRLRMHDVLRDMGRDIVKKEARRAEERTHLWDSSTAAKVLNCREANSNIRGIRLALGGQLSHDDYPNWERIKIGAVSCEASQLTSMKELHYLILDGCNVVVPDDFSSWPQELRWLQWRWFSLAKLPSQLKLASLVVLDLSCSDKLTQLWDVDAEIQLSLLESLILSGCGGLEELAENVGESLPKLKRLLMDGCGSLRRLPESIGHLTDLEELNLKSCSKLVSLPDEVGGLVSLKTLNLQLCMKLERLPEELGKLSILESLDLSYCSSLSELPSSVGGLKMLERLDMDGTVVKDLPAGFGLLTSLTSLTMPGLRTGPDNYQGLQALSSLRVVGALIALKRLDMSRNAAITTLPKSFGNLKWLVRLTIKDCLELFTVEALPEGLEHLDLSNCRKLTEIPSLAGMRSLVYLVLQDCSSLRHVYGLEFLSTLEHMDVSGCTSIEGRGIRMMGNTALRECDVSGSKIGVAYNSRWLEKEPAEQIIRCLGDAVPLLTNGMAKPVMVEGLGYPMFLLDATTSSEAECIALIFCLVVDYFLPLRVRVQVVRGGRSVVEARLFPLYRRRLSNQVLLWTLRREHQVVQSLQHGDQIRLQVRPCSFSFLRSKTVLEGAVCVVYYEDEKFILTNNSEVLSKSLSEDLATRFGQLVLEDKDEQAASRIGSELLSCECAHDSD